MRLVRMALAGVLVCGALAVLGGSSSSPSTGQRVDALLAKMTRAEKLTLLHGGTACGYVGCVDGIPRLGIPPLHLQDGPAGVGGSLTGVTQLPAPVAAAASWDPALMTAYGKVLGAEEWAKGANVVLAPTINIVRDPRWGRAFESLGEDPYLAGQSAAAEIAGIQSQGPIAQVKHYAVYNQETKRNTPGSDARIDERTMREIYLPAFEDAVNAGVGSVMCAYNPVNGTFPCENSELQEKILHDEFGFDGFITSDWDATHSTEASALGGLDMEMPGAKYFGRPLTDSTINVDESARRILTSMFRQGLFDNPPTGTPGTRVTSAANAAVARQIAEQGSVLLKNTGNLLPLDARTGSIAVIGNGGETSVLSQGGGSARVDPEYVVSPYQGLKERAPSTTYQPGTVRADGAFPPLFSTFRTNFFSGTNLSAAADSRADKVLDGSWRGGDPGTGRKSQWSARSTTTITPATTGTYRFSLSNTDGARLRVGDKTVIDTGWAEHKARTTTGSIALTAGKPVPLTVEYAQFTGNAVLTLGWLQPGQDLHNDAVRAAAAADLAVVVVGRFGTEGADLPDINLPEAQNHLVHDIAAANPNTVVVVNSGSAVTMPWAGSVRAIIESWFPGQEYGHALANLLYGDVNFSAKLPVTFPVSLADAPTADPTRFPGGNYSEGLSVGYRWYDTQNIQPLFEFGRGLSYTTFAYSDLAVSPPAPDGSVQLHYTITNTGKRAGAEIAQVYVQQPPAAGEPLRNLRGFAKIQLSPGQSQRLTTTLNARSFQHWQNGTWSRTPGTYTISVGASSRDLRLTGRVIE